MATDPPRHVTTGIDVVALQLADADPTAAVQYAVVTPDGEYHTYGDQTWVAAGTAAAEHHEPGSKTVRRRITLTYDDWQDVGEDEDFMAVVRSAAAPAGTGSPTPAEAGDGGSDPNWPARRLIQARARVDELVRERDAARAELSQVREQLDEAQAELDDWRATPPAELQSKVEAGLRAERDEAIAAAGPRGDKPLSVIVAEILAERDSQQRLAIKAGLELSQVQKERDEKHEAIRGYQRMLDDIRAATGTAGETKDDPPTDLRALSVVVADMRTARDEARSALAALRAEVGKIALRVDRLAEQAGDESNGRRPGAAAAAAGIASIAAALRALVTDQSPVAPRGGCPHGQPDGLRLHRETGQKLCPLCAGLSPTSDTQTDTGGEPNA